MESVEVYFNEEHVLTLFLHLYVCTLLLKTANVINFTNQLRCETKRVVCVWTNALEGNHQAAHIPCG